MEDMGNILKMLAIYKRLESRLDMVTCMDMILYITLLVVCGAGYVLLLSQIVSRFEFLKKIIYTIWNVLLFIFFARHRKLDFDNKFPHTQIIFR